MNRKKNKIAALTGSIATGKSFVSAYFRDHFGFKILDADKIGHAVLEKPETVEIIKTVFGKEYLNKGDIDRKLLGRAVFSDKEKLHKLNEIVHPEIMKESLKKIAELSLDAPVIFEAAVLFEAGWHKFFDTVILTTCDTRLQIKRIIARDALSEAEAMARISSQMPFEEKRKLADYIIDTSHGLSEAAAILNEIAEKLSN